MSLASPGKTRSAQAAKIHSAVTTRDKGLARTITGAGAAFKACELRKVNVACTSHAAPCSEALRTARVTTRVVG